MMEVAVWLVVVGLCDLVRAARDVTSVVRRTAIVGLGIALFVFAVVGLDGSAGQAVVLLLGWGASFVLWLLGSSASLAGRRVAARAAAFVGLGGGTAFCLLAGGILDPVRWRLPGPVAAFETETVFLFVGVGLSQLATANVAVRLVLDAVGVPAATNEKALKGGRMLGPMERLFIVGLGVAGEPTAAAVVVAAKGLLRFPELQRGLKAAGPSDITEYFLIGSFASWLMALGGLATFALGSVQG